jgi:hypothetical protein
VPPLKSLRASSWAMDDIAMLLIVDGNPGWVFGI